MSKATAGYISETIGVLQFDDDIDNQTSVKYEQYNRYGHPLTLVKLVSQTSTTRFYPYDGSGILAGVTSSTVVRIDNATDMPPDCSGLLLHMVSGTTANRGSTRRITADASKLVTLNRALPSTPVAGDGYVLLVEAFRLSQMIAKVEYSLGTNTVDVVPVFWDSARTPGNVLRAGIQFPDKYETLDNHGFQGQTQETSYYHGRIFARDVWGALGGKIYTTNLTGGSFSLWAGCV